MKSPCTTFFSHHGAIFHCRQPDKVKAKTPALSQHTHRHSLKQNVQKHSLTVKPTNLEKETQNEESKNISNHRFHGEFVNVRSVNLLARELDLTRSVIIPAPARLTLAALAVRLVFTPILFRGKSKLRHTYSFIPPSVAFTRSLHCFLLLHFTFAPLSSSELAFHVFLTSSSHLVQGLRPPLPLSTLNS